MKHERESEIASSFFGHFELGSQNIVSHNLDSALLPHLPHIMVRGYDRVSFPPEPVETRRSFSEIVPPPLLSSRHFDPLAAPRRFSEDSRDSDTDSDASGEEFDEKTHFVDDFEGGTTWDKAAALRNDRVGPSDRFTLFLS